MGEHELVIAEIPATVKVVRFLSTVEAKWAEKPLFILKTALEKRGVIQEDGDAQSVPRSEETSYYR
jgi:hypothetical protein